MIQRISRTGSFSCNDIECDARGNEELCTRFTLGFHEKEKSTAMLCKRSTRTGSSSSCAGSWDKHAVGQTALSTYQHRRDLVPPPRGASNRIGPPQHEACSAAGQRKRGGYDVHSRLQHGPWPAGHAGADRSHGKTGRRLVRAALPERTHHVTSENGWATTTTILQLAAALDNLLNPGREGQSWILLTWPASTPARSPWPPCGPHSLTSCSRSSRHKARRTYSPATWPSPQLKSCIQAQASTTLARSILDGSSDGLAMNKAWRRQSSAEWASRAVADLCEKNLAWSTGWHRLRAGSNAEFREQSAISRIW